MKPLHIVASATLMVAACATHTPPPTTVEPATETAAREATAPDRPLRVVFQWRAMEGDARFSGDGVARIEPPYSARLDLFGPRGDTYLVAALVGSDLRLPPGVAAVEIPPPALMWAVLGVVAPPERAVLTGTRETGDRAELYYDVDSARLRYVLEDGRLRSAQWDDGGRRRTVELRGVASHNLPAQATYRDLAAVTELILNPETVDESEPYPPEIWRPGD